MQLRNAKRAAVATLVVGLAAGGYGLLDHRYLARAEARSPAPATFSPPVPAAVATGPAPTEALPDFSAIVREYGPAVVNVSTTGSTEVAATPFGQLDPDDPFWQFFRHFGMPGPGEGGKQMTRGLGSGFVVRQDGVILTNAHVVAGASEVRVKLTDRREFPAKVVGIDKATDVAVLRIDARNLPTVRLGDPSRTQVGEWVLAIGAPFGFENSATAGIVSARARSLPDEGYVPFIQTDVAVNPGNSGGPLFNLAGEVIGINSQIYSRSGGYMGLSFAIPVDVAMKVEGQLLAHGKVERSRIGATVQDVNQQLAESFGLPSPSGALVASVEKGGPAEKAGVEPGDVILSLDGQAIATSSELPPRVADLAPGTAARLGIWHKGARREVEVVTGRSPDTAVASAGPEAARGRLGITVRPLTPAERREAEVPGGVRVEQVTGPAARAGIEPGDVVLSINGTPVTNVEQLREAIAKARKQVALLVQRGEARIFVPVALG